MTDSRYDFERRMRAKSAGIGYDLPPYLPWWVEVKVIFPFGGAAARVVFKDVKGPGSVSTYLDVDDQLGFMEGRPYFEIYPNKRGECERFSAGDQEAMYAAVVDSLRASRGRTKT